MAEEIDLAAGEALFKKECAFLLSAAAMDHLPVPRLPEIALAGRSNVGKSSLVNALTGRGTLAKTSNTPGRTQTLNFFDLAGRLMLVDMPGYGYAQVAKREVDAWTRLIKDYLRGRAALRRVFLLVDARHGLKANDLEIMALLDLVAVNYQLVLTKADKLKPHEAEARREETARHLARHAAAHPFVHLTSAETGLGIPELRAELAALAAPARET